MSRPEDIPQNVWDAAEVAAKEGVRDSFRDPLLPIFLSITPYIARAILSAEKRGEEREREGALSDLQAVLDDLPSHDPGVCLDMAIRAIRKRGEG